MSKQKETSRKTKLYPNPGLIFYNTSEGFVCCDPLRNNEFVLEPSYFDRLQFWDGKNEDYLTSIDEDLLEGDLLCEAPQDVSVWKSDRITYSYHLATRNHESATPKLSDLEVIEAFTALSNSKGDPSPRHRPSQILKIIPLPEASLDAVNAASFYETVKHRKTSRRFNAQAMSSEDLSTLLYMNFGPIHGDQWSELQDLGVNFSSERRANPSGSGLQACECYLTVAHVEGIDPGFYHYNSKTHALELLSLGCDDELHSYLMCDQFWIKGSAVGFFIVGDMERYWHKSTLPRNYAYIFLEAGHISQNLLLSATALGLKTWLSGTMRDGYVAEKFQVDGCRCFPVTAVFVGNGTDDAVPLEICELAKTRL